MPQATCVWVRSYSAYQLQIHNKANSICRQTFGCSPEERKSVGRNSQLMVETTTEQYNETNELSWNVDTIFFSVLMQDDIIHCGACQKTPCVSLPGPETPRWRMIRGSGRPQAKEDDRKELLSRSVAWCHPAAVLRTSDSWEYLTLVVLQRECDIKRSHKLQRVHSWVFMLIYICLCAFHLHAYNIIYIAYL